MIGIGSSTFYKMAVNSDGSPNWTGLSIVATTALAIFFWRCVVVGKQSEILIRLRYGRVVTEKYAPSWSIDGFSQFYLAKEYPPGIRLRLYAVHSLAPVNVANREATLGERVVTFCDRDYTISPGILWRISRDRGCPSKALFNVQDGDPKDKKNTELEKIVVKLVGDGVIRAYAKLQEGLEASPSLPILTIDDHLSELRDKLYVQYGVEFLDLLYEQHSVSDAQRGKEGNLAIAIANEKMAAAQNNMADAIRSHNSNVV